MRTALSGRCTPFELTYGKQPSTLNIRIFGCEALAYREKDKRAKFTPKVDQCIYVGISPNHSDDTYKLLNLLKTKESFTDARCSSTSDPFLPEQQKQYLNQSKIKKTQQKT
jgi:hypothetical protein